MYLQTNECPAINPNMNPNTDNQTSPDHTILLVENDPDDVFFFRQALREANLNVRMWVACNGQEAIDYLDRQSAFAELTGNSCPSLVLLDLRIPNKNGFEVLSWARQQPELERLVVVMLTSSTQPADIDRAYYLGANEYLVKPADFNSMVDLVKSIHSFWLGSSRPAQLANQPEEPMARSDRELTVPAH